MAEDESTIDLEEIIRIMFSNGSVTGQSWELLNGGYRDSTLFLNLQINIILQDYLKSV